MSSLYESYNNKMQDMQKLWWEEEVHESYTLFKDF